MRIAIVHYWLVGMRGGERVIEALCELFPDADIYTHVYDPEAVSETIRSHKVKTSFINNLPYARRWYQNYLPFMPLALEQLDLRAYDLVISSESGPAKGVIVSPSTVHICYCHTPMRYAWDMYHDYLETTSGLKRMIMPLIMHKLRLWDLASAFRVDYFIANSQFVAARIAKHYRRSAVVINPPVDTSSFELSTVDGSFYLMLGELVSYKRADLAVEAFNRLGLKLVIIGDGSDMATLKKLAKENITLLGRQSFSEIQNFFKNCKALIFPGIEDFGIVPVEAMAAGKPVIAYRKGGCTETVIDGVTGLFFDDQTPEALAQIVGQFESQKNTFNPEKIREHALKFDREIFKKRISEMIKELVKEKNRNSKPQSQDII